MWSSEDGDTISQCKDVTVFKEEHFYPINWRQWPWMFNVKFIKIFFAPCHDTLSKFGNCLNWKQLQAEHAADAMSRLNKSFIVHLWGSKSQGRLLKLKWILESPSPEREHSQWIFDLIIPRYLMHSVCPGSVVQAHSALAMIASDHCPVSREDTLVCCSQSEGSVTISQPIRGQQTGLCYSTTTVQCQVSGWNEEDDHQSVWPWRGLPMMAIPGIPSQHWHCHQSPQLMDVSSFPWQQLRLWITQRLPSSSSFSKQSYWL